jgi:serine/threonine-protein kinase HipA
MRFSLAGMQLKFSMRTDGNRFTFPVEHQDADWIVKVPDSARPDLPAIEHAVMCLAKSVGFDVPEVRQVPTTTIQLPTDFDHVSVPLALAVKRYDRTPLGRVHQEDLAQVLEWPRDARYADVGNKTIGYDGLAKLVGDLTNDETRAEFVRRVAFIVATGNNDAHLKNWSLLWPPGKTQPALAPVYDQVCTAAFPDYGWSERHGLDLALPLGGSRQLKTLNADRLARFQERSGCRDATRHFHEVLEQCNEKLQDSFNTFPTSMQNALREHWQRVPLLRRFAPMPAP